MNLEKKSCVAVAQQRHSAIICVRAFLKIDNKINLQVLYQNAASLLYLVQDFDH